MLCPLSYGAKISRVLIYWKVLEGERQVWLTKCEYPLGGQICRIPGSLDPSRFPFYFQATYCICLVARNNSFSCPALWRAESVSDRCEVSEGLHRSLTLPARLHSHRIP